MHAFPGVRLVDFGHLGDGNLHYNVQAPDGMTAADFVRDCEHAVNTLVYDAVGRLGGSISAEHGIGALKRDELARRKSPDGAGADARDQGRARPRGQDESGARAVAVPAQGHDSGRTTEACACYCSDPFSAAGSGSDITSIPSSFSASASSRDAWPRMPRCGTSP